MMTPPVLDAEHWAQQYAEVLATYARDHAEERLVQAAELGRTLGLYRVSLTRLTDAHMRALGGLLERAELPATAVVSAAATLFGRCVSAYEAARAQGAADSNGRTGGVMPTVEAEPAGERYRTLFDRVPVGLYRTTPDGRFIDANMALARIFGFESRAALMSRNVSSLYVNPQDRAEELAVLDEGGIVLNVDLEARRQDGTRIWVRDSTQAILGADGCVAYYEGCLQDITRCRHAEEELTRHRDHLEELVASRTREMTRLNERLESELGERQRAEEALRKFKTVADQAGYGVGIIDLAGHLDYVNRVFAEMHGYTPDELVGRHISVLHTPTQLPLVNALNERLRQRGSFVGEEVWHVRRDGSIFLTLMNATIIKDDTGQARYLSATAIDVTERKEAEAALRESEEKFRTLAETTPTGILIGQNRRLRYVNPAMCEILGYAPEELLNRPYIDFVHPEMRDQVGARTRAREAGLVEPERYEMRVVCKNGRERTLDFCTAVLEYEGRMAILGAALDITDRKRAEDALRASEERYRLLAENVTDIIGRYDVEGRCTYVSPACTIVLGYLPGELEGRLGYELVCPDDLDLVGEFHESVLREPIVRTIVHRLRRRNGDYIWVETAARARWDPRTNEVIEIIAVIRDITERRRAEEAVRQHQEQLAHVARVSTMGEMASELAHELSQPLSAVLYYARSCVSRLTAGRWGSSEAIDAMGKIATQAERAGEFIRRLKAFVRKAQPCRQPTNMNMIVQEALSFVAPMGREHSVTVQLELTEGLPDVVVDRIQIEQVILNLVRNGIESIAAARCPQRELHIQTMLGADGSVCVRVRDSGPGLEPNVAQHVFAPFFTTKPTGTGMGLSISQSIIEAHEGTLWVEPQSGRGAVFGFALPAAKESDDDE